MCRARAHLLLIPEALELPGPPRRPLGLLVPAAYSGLVFILTTSDVPNGLRAAALSSDTHGCSLNSNDPRDV